MDWPFMTTVSTVAVVFVMDSALHVFEDTLEMMPVAWVLPTYLTSLMGANVGYAVPLFNIVALSCLASCLHRLARRGRYRVSRVGLTVVGLFIRNLTRLIPLKILLVLLTGNFWVFGVMVGFLISMGVRKRRYF